MRWTEKDLAAYSAKSLAKEGPRPPLERSKYRAVRTEGPDGAGGTREYRSKLEAKLAKRLEGERQIGALACFIPEVSIPIGSLGGKPVRHVIDQLMILEIHPGGVFLGKLVEAKGFDVEKG